MPASLPISLQPELPGTATVKIIGLGGVGSILARYAAIYLASLPQEIRSSKGITSARMNPRSMSV